MSADVIAAVKQNTPIARKPIESMRMPPIEAASHLAPDEHAEAERERERRRGAAREAIHGLEEHDDVGRPGEPEERSEEARDRRRDRRPAAQDAAIQREEA